MGDSVRFIAVPIRDARGKIAISVASAAHYLTEEVRPWLTGAHKRLWENRRSCVPYAMPPNGVIPLGLRGPIFPPNHSPV